ncbi:type II secretion system F family protein [Paenarthrobacter sp. RAF54_2]|uniref:type II secretion system F family protein n=1 Tax=Paenarthrobacter sp. RAF54_2 TaxID=3233061 RepID=UPI003F9BE244
MIPTLVLALALAVWLQLKPPQAGSRRMRARLAKPSSLSGIGVGKEHATSGADKGPWGRVWRAKIEPLSLVVLVQQLAALLRGGRGQLQLWEDLWLVHSSRPGLGAKSRSRGHQPAPKISVESVRVLASARAASAVGNSPAQAIRNTSAKVYPGRGSTERRIWMELAACLDVAETSGCPLAELLTRFAAQLEAEEDSEAARQTALAGPKATVRLLSWLPVLGLVLGMALGVDPLGILLGNFLGVATLIVGLLLTVAGRVWSSRLVASAVGAT